VKVDVGRSSSLSGQIIAADAAGPEVSAPGGNARVRMINGKKYVWARGAVGTQFPGFWIPEEDARYDDPKRGVKSQENLRRLQEDIGRQ